MIDDKQVTHHKEGYDQIINLNQVMHNDRIKPLKTKHETAYVTVSIVLSKPKPPIPPI